jgi:hypothetical protein
MSDTFILETDESTRAPEIKGRPDLKKIVESNTYDVVSPIVNTKFILINEIDKASAGLRNSMLSIMNEKVLFNGISKVAVPWELFCASCNIIPNEEKNSPFWDRFTMKHEVKRITKKQLMTFYKNENDGKIKDEKIMIPEPHELESIKKQIPGDKLAKFLEVGHKHLTDRTLSYVPMMAAAVSVIFQLDLNQSMVKTAQILGGNTMAKDLSNIIEPRELAEMRNKIEMIASLTDYDQIENLIGDIKRMARGAANSPEVTSENLKEIAASLNKELSENTYYNPDSDPFSQPASQPSAVEYHDSDTGTDAGTENSSPF